MLLRVFNFNKPWCLSWIVFGLSSWYVYTKKPTTSFWWTSTRTTHLDIFYMYNMKHRKSNIHVICHNKSLKSRLTRSFIVIVKKLDRKWRRCSTLNNWKSMFVLPEIWKPKCKARYWWIRTLFIVWKFLKAWKTMSFYFPSNQSEGSCQDHV